MYVDVLPTSTLVPHVCTRHQQRSEQGTVFPATGVIEGCELLGGCWGPI